jgi:hypothetical protein
MRRYNDDDEILVDTKAEERRCTLTDVDASSESSIRSRPRGDRDPVTQL